MGWAGMEWEGTHIETSLNHVIEQRANANPDRHMRDDRRRIDARQTRVQLDALERGLQRPERAALPVALDRQRELLRALQVVRQEALRGGVVGVVGPVVEYSGDFVRPGNEVEWLGDAGSVYMVVVRGKELTSIAARPIMTLE